MHTMFNLWLPFEYVPEFMHFQIISLFLCLSVTGKKTAVFAIYPTCQLHPALKAAVAELKNIYSLSNTCDFKKNNFASPPQLRQQAGASAQTCVMCVQLPDAAAAAAAFSARRSGFTSPPSAGREKGRTASSRARTTRHFSFLSFCFVLALTDIHPASWRFFYRHNVPSPFPI